MTTSIIDATPVSDEGAAGFETIEPALVECGADLDETTDPEQCDFEGIVWVSWENGLGSWECPTCRADHTIDPQYVA